ncbi:uncharacterized protein EDB91DRAFT_1253601 [Suillus paluster]|uniref:uncharacterized protein n=1 Tax=Suillus paluster TaxID=48578 RepID=UPI001B8602A0|nr:uncharacterized protein EDB91DRAFT_1253601 [Suillus paluster]KAG1728180.1 hypothetical protein EDB91DRAFT_1253601 [Suillus paluster]
MTTSSSKDQSTPCSPGIMTLRSQSSTCRMCCLRLSLAQWRKAFGTPEEWTVPEFLASKVIRFYQQDWTLYLYDHSPNHKESVKIMEELEDATGIDARTFVAFEPEMKDAREKLRWASTRVTTVQEDIAYSVVRHLRHPATYPLCRVTSRPWTGSENLPSLTACLPDDISSYEAPPCAPPFLSEDEIQTSVSSLRNAVVVESALNLYSLLVKMSPPLRRRGQAQGPYFTYEVKADGLHDLQITTEDRLIQFSRARPARQTFVLSEEDWSEPGSPSHDSSGVSPGENDPPFGAFLLAQQRGGEYRRIVSDCDIIAQVNDMASVHGTMDVRTLEILS